MSIKTEWVCDVCNTRFNNRQEAIQNLAGCNFSGMRKFKLDTIDSTQGTHICIHCLAQLYKQAKDYIGDRLVLEETK
jgi:hypothetical protein